MCKKICMLLGIWYYELSELLMVVVSLSYFSFIHKRTRPCRCFDAPQLAIKNNVNNDRFVFFTSEKPSKMSVSGKISDHIHQPDKWILFDSPSNTNSYAFFQ